VKKLSERAFRALFAAAEKRPSAPVPCHPGCATWRAARAPRIFVREPSSAVGEFLRPIRIVLKIQAGDSMRGAAVSQVLHGHNELFSRCSNPG